MTVAIVQTGTANLASVAVAFERLGVEVAITRDAGVVAEAQSVVLPGVGTFEAGMSTLTAAALGDCLRARIEARRPTLAICLGLQLLGCGSDESTGVEGLGVIDSVARRLNDAEPVPQMGWNEVQGNGGLIQPGWAYFANSYAFTDVQRPWRTSFSEHGRQPFVAAVQCGPVLACQFHPELSGAWGADLLRRWLKEASC